MLKTIDTAIFVGRTHCDCVARSLEALPFLFIQIYSTNKVFKIHGVIFIQRCSRQVSKEIYKIWKIKAERLLY